MKAMLTSLPIFLSCWLLGGVFGKELHHSNVVSHDDGETIVRSFLPIGGHYNFMKLANNELLFFNLSVIGSDEEISKAHLHLHRRRMSKLAARSHDRQLLPSPCRVVLYQARSVDSKPRRLTSIPVTPQTQGGWMPVDVAAALRELHGRPLLFAVRFEGPKGVRLTIGNFLKPVKSKKNNSVPAYLIVFSKSDLDEGLDEPKERHLKHKERKIDKNEMTNDVKRHAGEEEVRHRSKHKIYEVKRSKEAALALQKRTHLQSLPFLHVNEVADMRRSLKKAKRSLSVSSSFSHSNKDQVHIQDKTQKKHQMNNSKQIYRNCNRRHTAATFTNNWILTPFSKTNMCEGFCDIQDSVAINATEKQKGCCRPGNRSALTMIIADGGHSLALHKLPGDAIEDCICAPCI